MKSRPAKPAATKSPWSVPIQARGPSRAAIVAGVFAIALGLRALNVWRPVDGSIWNSWREANTAAIARNFHEEGMNILYPRIDWRGTGPGFVATEFPLHPYLGAVLYRTFGYHEEYLRLISLAAAVLSCYVFWRLADRVLDRWPAVVAFGFFAVHPLLVASASWIQPEPLMLLAYLAAVDQFDRWIETSRWRRYVAAWLATSVAILLLLPAAHLLLLFALVPLRKYGRQAARRLDLWFLAVLSILPAALWYRHAHGLWLEHGHWLGVSAAIGPAWSASHWRALPLAAWGLVTLEAARAWMPPGLIFALPAGRSVLSSRPRLIGEWALALAAFYVATAPTTASSWAYYYHLLSVPLVALAVGASTQFLFEAIAVRPLDLRVGRGTVRQMWIALALVTAAYGLVAWAIHYLVDENPLLLAVASLVGILGGGVLVYLHGWARGRSPRARSRRLRVWLAGLMLAASLTAGWSVAEVRRYFQGRPEMFASYEAALQFAPRARDKGPIAVSGPVRRDAFGRALNGTAPYYFYWLKRKGFAVPADELSLEKLRELTRRGVRFFIAERGAWDSAPVLEGILRRQFRVVEDHPMATLFDLAPPAEGE